MTQMSVATPQTKETAKVLRPTPKTNVLTVLFGFFVWQIIAILFVESILFAAGLGEEEIFKFDPELGSKHMTSKRVTWRSEGYAVSYLDADGMREPNLTIAKPANTYRVALLGDSMVEGLQVPIEKTFGQLLSKQLKTPDGMDVQILNFATSGYSTAQEYIQLKRQVMKYKPDLVLLGYDSRDIFENWSAPDQTITNLRPVALHLPGGNLVIDTSPVALWLNSRRGKFLQQIDWVRHNSRIWGYFSALQTEMSFRDPLYRALCQFIDKPTKNWRPFLAAFGNILLPTNNAEPSFAVAKFEKAPEKVDATAKETDVSAGSKSENVKEELFSFAPNKSISKGAEKMEAKLSKEKVKTSTQAPKDGRTTYIELITRTQKSLIDEMRKICQTGGAKFAVVLMPSRAALCPAPNMETAFMSINYQQEMQMLQAMCNELSIPVCNMEVAAENLNMDERAGLFYSVHFTPRGQEFAAQVLKPFLLEQFRN
jgi:hypothetical protein